SDRGRALLLPGRVAQRGAHRGRIRFPTLSRPQSRSHNFGLRVAYRNVIAPADNSARAAGNALDLSAECRRADAENQSNANQLRCNAPHACPEKTCGSILQSATADKARNEPPSPRPTHKSFTALAGHG